MSKIITGLFGIAFGIFVLIHFKNVKDFFGDIAWAERHFGSGGTYTLIKLIGIGISVFSFLYMTGTLEDFIDMIGLKKFLFMK